MTKRRAYRARREDVRGDGGDSYSEYIRRGHKRYVNPYGGGFEYQHDSYARTPDYYADPRREAEYEERVEAAPEPRRKRAKQPKHTFVHLGKTRHGTSFMTFVILGVVAVCAIFGITSIAVMSDKQRAIGELMEASRKESENVKSLRTKLYDLVDKDEIEARALELGMMKPAEYKVEHIAGVKQGFVAQHVSGEEMTAADAIKDVLKQVGAKAAANKTIEGAAADTAEDAAEGAAPDGGEN